MPTDMVGYKSDCFGRNLILNRQGNFTQGRSGIGLNWSSNGKCRWVNGLEIGDVRTLFSTLRLRLQTAQDQGAEFIREALFELGVPNQDAGGQFTKLFSLQKVCEKYPPPLRTSSI